VKQIIARRTFIARSRLSPPAVFLQAAKAGAMIVPYAWL
jgi:hypothetical protein